MNLLTQVKAVREGGAVVRCHTVPRAPYYDNAQHQYGAVSLLLLLHPNPSVGLIRAVLWHDVAERWVGDVPAPAKLGNETLKTVLGNAEQAIMERLGLGRLIPAEDMDQVYEDVRWLKAVDILELWLWCRENMPAHDRMTLACQEYIGEKHKEGTFPKEAWDFFRDEFPRNTHIRLPDRVDCLPQF